MVLKALQKGFSILGFSGHAPVSFDTAAMSVDNTHRYIEEIRNLQTEYGEQINIYLGLEEDTMNRLPAKEPFSFIIGSVHFLKHEGTALPIDFNKGVVEYMLEYWYENDFRRLAQAYYAEVRKMADWDEVDIIGHLDLITKFNEDESLISFSDPVYVKEACDTIDALAEKKILEINTGAIARGYRTKPYPAENLLKYMYEKNVRICLNSDCHDAEYLDCGFEDALYTLKKIGFRTMMRKTADGFAEEDIESFE